MLGFKRHTFSVPLTVIRASHTELKVGVNGQPAAERLCPLYQMWRAMTKGRYLTSWDEVRLL